MPKQTLKGRLFYTGWFNLPWTLVTNNGAIDLWLVVEKFFCSLNGRRAKHDRERDGYVLCADEKSDFAFEYVLNKYVLLNKIESFGCSNVFAYLDDSLIWLSGRMVKIEVSDNELKFSADKSENVHGVYFVGDGSLGEIPKGDEKAICGIDRGTDCCIFLLCSGDGFKCGKFNSSLSRTLLNQLVKEKMRAKRIGNCACLGRKDKVSRVA